MKKILCVLSIMLLCSNVLASTHVRGYYRSNGTYVQPHYRSNANYTRLDNYSTRGNINPYTGAKGYANPYNTYKPLPTYNIPQAQMMPTQPYSRVAY